MEKRDLFNHILNELALGSLASPVTNVTGGLMHKMFCVETTTGKYAIKLLNSAIMKRSDVFDNYKVAEYLESVLQFNDIPIVPALIFDGKKMQCISDQYFYVYNWVDGKALSSDEIKQEHCKLMGSILAKIHKIEQRDEDFNGAEISIDWDSYIHAAYKNCPEIANLLKENKKLLYEVQERGSAAIKRIPKIAVISNGDMDSKNVLWVKGEPKIIDLECLKYGNPYTELFQLALYWSGYDRYRIDYKLLNTFIKAYIHVYGDFDANWEDLYHCNYGLLEWLEYSVKRALMIEYDSDEERQLGIEQTHSTTKKIIYYHSIKEKLIEGIG